MTPHDGELDRLGLLLIALVAVMAITGLLVLMSAGQTWLLPIGMLASIASVAALMWMFTRMTGSEEPIDMHQPAPRIPADSPGRLGEERSRSDS